MTAPARIGHYEIVRQIGRSMTEVYLAIDTVEHRKAALKLIRQDNGSVTRMVTEAERRGAAILRSIEGVDPRVVRIYDFGDVDGYFFVAMQYVEGRSLAEVLEKDHAIDANRAAVIALEICEQLSKFHSWEAAVVHGDIKPSNIHLGPNDTVRLLDFGIAKMLRANGDATLHQFGSPSYCAPERLTRSAVDEQSDLWAVGATLYEMLAGVPPYRAQDTRRLESLIRSKRPPGALPSACPRGLREIVTKALAPEPGRRYASAAALQADLQAFLERKPTVAEKERRAARYATAGFAAAREYLRKATRTVVRTRQAVQVARAAAWFGMGMALWIGGTLGWQAWHRRPAVHQAPPPVASPKPAVRKPSLESPELYAAEAEQVLAAYRTSGDPRVDRFDWQKAELYLQRAVKLGGGDDRTLGELALTRGYATLARLGGGSYTETAAAQLRVEAREQFAVAARKMPHDADPHLALARLYVYALPDLEKATEEFAVAERLGGQLGRRETEQQADAYRLRAERNASSRPRAAWADARKARALYARIAGFDQVDEHVRQLNRLHYGGRRRHAWR